MPGFPLRPAALTAVLIALVATAQAHAQDAAIAAGRNAFGVCRTCHSDVKGRSGFGPSLYGVAGRKAGSLPGYAYSDAMKASGIVWDDAALNAFIAAPRDTVKGTYMPYAGMKDAGKRAAVIAYLKSLK